MPTLLYTSLANMMVLSFLFLNTNSVFADNDSVIDQTEITVPVSCTMSGIGMNSHNTEIINGNYDSAIGTTTLSVFCNDSNGFAIYAIGFTDDEHGKTVLTSSALGSTHDIITGTATSGGTSNWAMKVATDSNATYPIAIQNSFDAFKSVPSNYTMVAKRTSGTGFGTGATPALLTTTYQAYISSSQPAGNYVGQVKYVLVHPNNADVPLAPQKTESGEVCYYANVNDVSGAMSCSTLYASDVSVKLSANNFERTGYGFAGWSDTYDYATNPNAHFYGPSEEITFTAGQYSGDNDGLSLYAVWVESAGTLQSDASSVCESLTQVSLSTTPTLSSVSALTDSRDGNTYTIAKLADGNCWMTENLRLDDSATLTINNTNNPLNDGNNVILTIDRANGIVATHLPTSLANYNYYYDSIDEAAILKESSIGDGVYYNWYAATAGNGTYDTVDTSAEGDICPAGWTLPWFDVYALTGIAPNYYSYLYGDYYNGDYYAENPESVAVASSILRGFPSNFTFSQISFGWGGEGFYWTNSASADDENKAIAMHFDNDSGNYAIYPSENYDKRNLLPVRCMMYN